MYAKRPLDVLYQALSQCDLSGSCSIFHNHLFKVNQAFLPLSTVCVLQWSIASSISFMRSFKAFLLSGVLSLVCLCVCFVCLYRWLMRVEWAWFESLKEYEDEEFWATSLLWLKASVSLIFVLRTIFNHFAYACI
jgi:hypothetical protein